LVKLTDAVWDESFGEKGMIARVTRAGTSECNPDGWEFDLDYMEHRDANMALQSADWAYWKDGKKVGRGTATETGNADPDDLREKMFVDDKDGDVPMELLEEGTIAAEYAASGSGLPYVEWLEAKLEELVPNAMKTWRNEL